MGHIEKIIAKATSYIGQEEIKGNHGFKDPNFAKKMNAVGFYDTASWCAFFVMVVLYDVYSDDAVKLKYLKKYCSPSTRQMWLNFKASKEIITGQIPKLGSIVIWQEGDSTSGHTGIVVEISADGKTFSSIEGNTSVNGSREGIAVGKNKHSIGLPHSKTSLNILGFGYLPD